MRVLEAVRWHDDVESDFFARGCLELPRVMARDYRRYPSSTNLPERLADLRRLEREIAGQLGRDHPAASLLLRRCRSAQVALRLIAARGTREFAGLSRQLFGSSLSSASLRTRLLRLIRFFEAVPETDADSTLMSAEIAADILRERLHQYFGETSIDVRVANTLVADACAGGGYLKLRRGATFTAGDIDLLEAHEGWAHLGTMQSGLRQPIFTVLAKSSPCTTTTQEGLAVLTEIMVGACHSRRRQRLACRLRAVMMAEEGADFLEVFHFLRKSNDDRRAYQQAARVFRGSLPSGIGPFTKDLSYGIGLLELIERLQSLPESDRQTLPLLLSGKTCLSDLNDLEAIHNEGLLIAGEFIPPPFRNLAGFRRALAAATAW